MQLLLVCHDPNLWGWQWQTCNNALRLANSGCIGCMLSGFTPLEDVVAFSAELSCNEKANRWQHAFNILYRTGCASRLAHTLKKTRICWFALTPRFTQNWQFTVRFESIWPTSRYKWDSSSCKRSILLKSGLATSCNPTQEWQNIH